MSNLYKGFYAGLYMAGMPRNEHLESKTPHCAFAVIQNLNCLVEGRTVSTRKIDDQIYLQICLISTVCR